MNARDSSFILPLSRQQQFARRLQVVDHVVEKPCGGGAVDDPVVVGKTQRHHQPAFDLALVDAQQPARTAQQ